MNLADDFFRHAKDNPSHPALLVGERLISYGELAEQAARIAGWIRANVPGDRPRIGIWADRTFTVYAGILGTLWAGATYVPLSSKFPKARLAEVVSQARLSAVIFGDLESILVSEDFLPLLPLVNLAPFVAGRKDFSKKLHFQEDLDKAVSVKEPVRAAPDSYAYLMFTSGTTGRPKGIPVTLENVRGLITASQDRYQLNPEDRLSQYSELTFDLSVFDMFMAWQAGASIYVVPDDQLLTPVNFIRAHELTVWFSVPSLIGLVSRLKLLPPDCLPSLRYSLFCGESFTRHDAESWQEAAPNSVVENLYGPTEATVFCGVQQFAKGGVSTPARGILPIGKPLPGMSFAVFDEAGSFLDDNQEGELAISGPQVTPGYWRRPELTEARYHIINHSSHAKQRWYLTGDKVYRDSSGVYHFLGRLDNQVKIGGHRVELEEVEFHIREISGGGEVVVVSIPDDSGDKSILIAATNRRGLDQQIIKRNLRARLPGYMIPHRIFYFDDLPRNQNGKVDRKATVILLGEKLSETKSQSHFPMGVTDK